MLRRGKFKATAARFDKPEPAVTRRSRTAGSQDESRCSAIHKFNDSFNGVHPAMVAWTLRRQNLRRRAVFQSTWLCVELRSILPFSAGVAFAVPLSLAKYIVILRIAFDALTAVLFPAPCRICGTTLLNASRIPICDSCLASFEPIQQPMCECCGRPMPAAAVVDDAAADALTAGADGVTADAATAEKAQLLCRLCRGGYYAFDRARTYGVYNDALHHAILLLKYEEVTQLGDWFAARLADIVAREGEAFRADVIVPVPLHPDRQRERGYNQAELIARPLARRLHLKQGAYLLMRTKPRPARLVLTRKEHWDSVRGAYATRKGLRVDKLRVLLLDDVLTTGATLDSCARALKQAGAAAVMGLTVARVVPGWSPTGPQQQSQQETESSRRNQQGATSIPRS
jgi:ComF family protein